MWKANLIILLLCALNSKNCFCVQSTNLDHLTFARLRMDQEDFSGSLNDSESSGLNEFDDQLQHQLKTSLDEDLVYKPTSKPYFQGSGQEPVEDFSGRFGQSKESDWVIDSSGDSSGSQFDKPAVKEDGQLYPLTRKPLKAPVPQSSKNVQLPGSRLTENCEEIQCADDKQMKVKLTSAGGNKIPSGVSMVLQCSISSYLNDSVRINWFLPDSTGDGSGLFWEDIANFKQTEEINEKVSANERVTEAVLRVGNISAETAGIFMCQAISEARCCYRNASTTIVVYTPPSVSIDIAIVLAVCFIEFVLIMFLKNRSDKECKADNIRSNVPYKHLQIVQSKT